MHLHNGNLKKDEPGARAWKWDLENRWDLETWFSIPISITDLPCNFGQGFQCISFACVKWVITPLSHAVL